MWRPVKNYGFTPVVLYFLGGDFVKAISVKNRKDLFILNLFFNLSWPSVMKNKNRFLPSRNDKKGDCRFGLRPPRNDILIEQFGFAQGNKGVFVRALSVKPCEKSGLIILLLMGR